ncbi:38111_t:CDS:1, partial [Gigaspora margarita]
SNLMTATEKLAFDNGLEHFNKLEQFNGPEHLNEPEHSNDQSGMTIIITN